MSNFLEELALARVAGGVSVDLSAAPDTEVVLFTVPSGFAFIPVQVILHSWSADPTTAVVTLGKSGGTCDEFLGDQTLTAITAAFADQAAILQPVPAATPVLGMFMDAGESFAIEITTAGAGTCKAEVLGILITV